MCFVFTTTGIYNNYTNICYRMEIKQIKGSSYIKAVLVSYSAFHTRISLFFSILSYVLLGNRITAQKVTENELLVNNIDDF